MLHTDISCLPFERYNRFFVIGCSFTQWDWPTWAHVIQRQHPHLELINLGKGGAGNLYINSVFSQADLHYDLCETDLVGIMWSSFHRADYYQSAEIPTLMTSSPEFHKSVWHWQGLTDLIGLAYETNPCISDDRGYLIRDCGIIHNCTNILKHAKYGSFQMFSVAPEHQCTYDPSVNTFKQDVLDMYSGLQQCMLGQDLFSFMGYEFKGEFRMVQPWQKECVVDLHPTTSQYLNYLRELGMPIDASVQAWATQCDNHVRLVQDSLALQTDPDWPYTLNDNVLPL